MRNLLKEEQIVFKRLQELALTACHKGICTYSEFLTLSEVHLFFSILQELEQVPFSLNGGYPDAERKLICFHGDLELVRKDITDSSDAGTAQYPIVCVKLSPSNIKFSENLTHRDFMGAILSLGIDRGKIGDIIVRKPDAFAFCHLVMGQYIRDNLQSVRHTNIRVELEGPSELQLEREFQLISGTVSSIRLDSVISTAFHLSRTNIQSYISSGKVCVNGKESLNSSQCVKEGDIISVRGLGKVKFQGQGVITKKGRIGITLLKYN